MPQTFPSRIIVLSSLLHKYSSLDVTDLHYRQRPYSSWLGGAYSQSKMANVLFVKELARRWGQGSP